MTRFRFTRTVPLTGVRVGPMIWWGSIDRGWTGKPLNPLRWMFETWHVGAAEKETP